MLFYLITVIFYLINRRGGNGSCDPEAVHEQEESTDNVSTEVEAFLADQKGVSVMGLEGEAVEPLNSSTLQARDHVRSGPKVGDLACLKCWYTNATSLNAEKLDELRVICADIEPDIIFITETWYDSRSIIHIEGYECFRKDRGDKTGGGVCIYARTTGSIVFPEVDFAQLRSGGIEQVWCAVDVGIESVILGCIYRPDTIRASNGMMCDRMIHKERDEEINRSIEEAARLVRTEKYSSLILVGDFNYPEIKLSKGLVSSIKGCSQKAEQFIDTLNSNFLTQNVHQKTYKKRDADSGETRVNARIYKVLFEIIFNDAERTMLRQRV